MNCVARTRQRGGYATIWVGNEAAHAENGVENNKENAGERENK